MGVQFTYFLYSFDCKFKTTSCGFGQVLQANPNLSDYFRPSKVFENCINFILGKKCADVLFSTGGVVVC